MVNAQEWLDKEYPNKTTVTKIKRKHFTKRPKGELVIDNFPNLQEIDVSVFRKGKLTKLKISNCPQLCKLNCENNQLEELDIDEISRQQLKRLNHKRNKLSELQFDWVSSNEPVASDVLNNSDHEQENNSDGYSSGEEEINKEGFTTDNWQSIHPDFTPRLQELWEEHELTIEEVRAWIKQGLSPTDYDLVNYLEKRGYVPEQELNLDELRKKYADNLDWKNIHRYFANVSWQKKWTEAGFKSSDIDYAKKWTEAGFIAEETKQLIVAGFQLDKYWIASQWKEQKFITTQILEWVNIGLKKHEFGFASYLRQKGCWPHTPDIKEIIKKESWQDINKDFSYWWRNRWEEKNFSHEQVEEWIDTGLKPEDVDYARWLRDIKGKDAKHRNDKELRKEYRDCSKLNVNIIRQIKDFNHDKLTPEQEWLVDKLILDGGLKKRYIKYGLCKECNQVYTGGNWPYNWCQLCNSKRFQKEFKNWTSGNPEIDEFIQKYQLNAARSEEILEWIPYERLTNVEYLAEGGFGKVYKAKWIDEKIKSWNIKNNKWNRMFFDKDNGWEGEDICDVVLKSLNSSQVIKKDFLQEITYYKLFDDDSWVVNCYGISQDPVTKNYLMVMKYIKDGSLRKYLNAHRPIFENKLHLLWKISDGLSSIHERGLVHRDFHSGNILKKGVLCWITLQI